MAHPKRKISKTRRDKRRSHLRLVPKTLIECSNCSEIIQYHTVCPSCGYYKGRMAIEKDIAV